MHTRCIGTVPVSMLHDVGYVKEREPKWAEMLGDLHY